MKEERSGKPMAFCAEEPLKKAVAHAIVDHKRTVDSITTWRNGKVAKI